MTLVTAFLAGRRRLLVMVAAVGISGGAIGAAFVGLIHVRGLWPTHSSLVAHLFILVGVGLVVGLLTAWLGPPGDVELLVNKTSTSWAAPTTSATCGR